MANINAWRYGHMGKDHYINGYKNQYGNNKGNYTGNYRGYYRGRGTYNLYHNSNNMEKKKKKINTSIIHTINVKKIHNRYGNKINTVKKVHNIISGKLYGMNIDIYYKDRSVAGEIGLIDSGSAYSLMGI